jgi:hypothetical protein
MNYVDSLQSKQSNIVDNEFVLSVDQQSFYDGWVHLLKL